MRAVGLQLQDVPERQSRGTVTTGVAAGVTRWSTEAFRGGETIPRDAMMMDI